MESIGIHLDRLIKIMLLNYLQLIDQEDQRDIERGMAVLFYLQLLKNSGLICNKTSIPNKFKDMLINSVLSFRYFKRNIKRDKSIFSLINNCKNLDFFQIIKNYIL